MTLIKKVTIVGPLAPPAGGMANQTKKLADFLRSEHMDVQVIRTNADYRPSFIGKIPVVRAVFRLFFYIVSLLSNLKNTDVIHIMANSGWSWHLFAAPAIAVGRFYNKPIVVNYRGGYAQEFFDKSWRWVNLTLSKSHKVIVPSSFLQDVFSTFKVKAEIVPNVLDETLFSPVKSTSASSSPHIIVARNLEAIYDVATAIQAFALIKATIPSATLSIAGTGPELPNLTNLVAQLNLKDSVTFTGRLSPSEMAKLYQSADIMLNASTVDNTPNAIIESLACGTPVVTTNAGGIPKLVSHQHDAMLVDIGDRKLMAEHAVAILKDSKLAESMVGNGLNTISKFYWPNVWLNLKACYHDAVIRSKTAGKAQ